MPSVRVPARVGLLGNPSDAFGGRVISATVADMAASVSVEPSPEWVLEGPDGSFRCSSATGLGAAMSRGELADGLELVGAAVVALAAAGRSLQPAHVRFESTIPRQVGLSGSSAVIVATMRALTDDLTATALARHALAAEVDILGWAAGPQDRVVQAMGGLVDMRFDEPWDPARYERLDPDRLPGLVLAWDPDGTVPSGRVHAPVRDRWLAGDPEVVSTMDRFATLAAEGRAALDQDRTAAVWPALADEAFELRTRLWDVGDRDRAMVEVARAAGGGATLAGSGGAVVAFLPEPAREVHVRAALEGIGVRAIVPTIGAPT